MISTDKIKYFHQYYCDLVGFDIEEESKKTTRKIALFTNQYDYEQALINSYNNINTLRFEYALYYIQSIADMLFDDFKNSVTSNASTELLEQFAKHIEVTKEIKLAYKDWMENDFKSYLSRFEKTNLFKTGELDEIKDFDILNLIEIEKSIDEENLLKFFCYHQGKESMDEFGKDVSIATKMIISKSSNEFLSYFKNEPSQNETKISLVMKIEKRQEFSYFIVIIKYKDYLWLCTDVSNFDNPQNRETRRNERCRHPFWDKLNLPYHLIEELPALTKKKSGLKLLNAPEDVDYTLYPIENLPSDQKIYFLTLANKCVDKINSGTKFNMAITMGDYINQKLIAGDVTFTPDELINLPEDQFDNWDDACKERATEVLDILKHKGKSETALVKINHDIIVKDRHFDKDWLATPEKMETIIKWIALNRKSNAIQKVINFSEEDEKKAWKELDALINRPENIQRLYKFMFSAKQVYFKFDNFFSWMIHVEREGSCFWNEKIKHWLFDFCHPHKESLRRTDIIIGDTGAERDAREDEFIKKNPYQYRRGYWKDYYRYINHPPCKICGKDKKSIMVKDINVQHYFQLLFLIGENDRAKLPAYFQNFKAHAFIPYKGNSILNNLHPFSDLKDSCSASRENGINMSMSMCKICSNRMTKQLNIGEESIIHGDWTLHPHKPKKSDGKFAYI